MHMSASLALMWSSEATPTNKKQYGRKQKLVTLELHDFAGKFS